MLIIFYPFRPTHIRIPQPYCLPRLYEKFLGNSIFKAVGWTYDVDPTILEKKQVIIGFEHTSNLDAILSIALFQILDLKIHTLIKRAFKGPMKPILENLGGIPVDRKASKDIVSQMVENFKVMIPSI